MSVISNNLLIVRDGETLCFCKDDEARLIFVDLDGYAIVPLEQYEDRLEMVKGMRTMKDAEAETNRIIESITKEQ